MKLILILFASIVLFNACGENGDKSTMEVNLFTHRHYDSDKKLFKEFEEKYGIKVNVVKASADELISRLEREGEKTSADLLITVDAGRLHLTKEKGILQPVESKLILENIPSSYRDSENYWFGLTKRARIIAYSKDRVNPSEIVEYMDLIEPKWKGKILVRSSSNIYNQSLISAFYAHDETGALAKEFCEGIVRNLARNPSGSDRDQIKAIASGLGDIAIVNSYYIGNMINSEDENEKEAVSKIGIIYPKMPQSDGSHINISGIGVTKFAKNKENAIKLIEFLSSKEAQHIFASENYEYSVRIDLPAPAIFKDWGELREDTISFESIGAFNNFAVRIMDNASWK